MKTFLIVACGFALTHASDPPSTEIKEISYSEFFNTEADRMINYSTNIYIESDYEGNEILLVTGELGAKQFSIDGIGTKSSSAYNGFYVSGALGHDHMETNWKFVECSALWQSTIEATQTQCDCTGYKMHPTNKYGDVSADNWANISSTSCKITENDDNTVDFNFEYSLTSTDATILSEYKGYKGKTVEAMAAYGKKNKGVTESHALGNINYMGFNVKFSNAVAMAAGALTAGAAVVSTLV